MFEMTDWRGRAIAAGATILYVRRHGSTVDLIEAEVLEVGDRSLIVQATASTGYGHAAGSSALTAMKNVTVLREAP